MNHEEDRWTFPDPKDTFLELSGMHPGARIGDFELIRLIGEGGTAFVWEAHRPELDQRVAIKIIPMPSESQLDSAVLLRGERALGRLAGHDGIGKLHHAGIHEHAGVRMPWFALELVQGARTLKEAARDLDGDARIELMLQLCDALRYAHAKGVLHLDLKPSNVLVSAPSEGAAARVKVIDFGIAPGLSSEVLGRVHAFGTLGYMSPERLRGEPTSVDVAADIYSLGVVLHELWTGERPFAIDAPHAARSLHTADQPQAELERIADSVGTRGEVPALPGLGGDLARIVHKALAADPRKRHAHVQELIADLEALRASRPLRSLPVGAGRRARLWWRRNGRRSLAAAGGLTLVAGVGAYVNRAQGDALADFKTDLAQSEADLSRTQTAGAVHGQWLVSELTRELAANPWGGGPASEERVARFRERLHELVRAHGVAAASAQDELPARALRAALALCDEDPAAALEFVTDADRSALRLADSSTDLRETVLMLRGQALRATGDREGALACCDEYLELVPNSGSILVIRAKLLGELQRNTEAAETFDRAVERGDDAAWAHENRAQFRANTGDIRGARDDFGMVTELAPTRVQARFNYAVCLNNLRDLTGALDQMEVVVKHAPEKASAYKLRGMILCNLGRYERAHADLVRAEELALPEELARVVDRNLFVLRARSAIELRRGGEALDDLRRLQELLPNDPDTISLEGHAQQVLGHTELALAAYARSLSLRDTLRNRERRGILLSHLGRWEEALADFERALELGGLSRPLLTNHAVALLQTGRSAELVQATRAALERYPEDVGLHYYAALGHRDLGQLDEALEILDACVVSDPTSVTYRIERASVRHSAGRFADGLADAQWAVLREPANPRAQVVLGGLQSVTGADDEAFESFSKAIALDATRAVAWYGRGFCRVRAGDLVHAEADFSEALALIDDLAPALRGLATCELADGRTGAARAHLVRAVEVDAGDVDAWFFLGLAHARLDDLEPAAEAFERALALADDLVEAHLELGQARLALEQPAAARASFERVLQLESTPAQRSAARKALDELR